MYPKRNTLENIRRSFKFEFLVSSMFKIVIYSSHVLSVPSNIEYLTEYGDYGWKRVEPSGVLACSC